MNNQIIKTHFVSDCHLFKHWKVIWVADMYVVSCCEMCSDGM